MDNMEQMMERLLAKFEEKMPLIEKLTWMN
jgi:hypothetical protein